MRPRFCLSSTFSRVFCFEFRSTSAINNSQCSEFTHIYSQATPWQWRRESSFRSLFIVTQSGDLYGFGVNDACQLGIGNRVNQPRLVLIDKNIVFNCHSVVMVLAGSAHAACVTSNSSVYVWGSGQFGQLALSDFNAATRVPHWFPERVFGKSPVRTIACGADFPLVLTENGLIWSSGDAQTGQLGNSDHQIRTHFRHIDTSSFDDKPIGLIAAGYGHSMALSREGGRLWTWGLNWNGQLAHGKWDFSVSTLTLVLMDSAQGDCNFVYVDGCSDFSMAIT